jgi:viroplasmin and RNaseH domain-containing protein
VENYPNAKYKSYNTQEEAIRAYRGNPADEMGVLRAIANAPVRHINY